MKIGLVGSSGQERSLPFNAQRLVNMYTVLDKDGKEPAALYGTPGLTEFAELGSGPIRGCFSSSNGRAFAVSGGSLYEIDENGTETDRGTFDTNSGTVTIDENPTQLAICDGTDVYIFTYATNVFAKVTDSDLPDAGTITFIDGYFIINKVDTGIYYISALNDGTSWDALDFASAESSPDSIERVINAVGQAWLLGKNGSEIHTNTGDSAFPFERISGAKMEVGILAKHSAVAMDNSVIWVGQDKNGRGIVYRAKGFSPQRISTSAVEYAIQQADDLEDMRAFSYQQDGHVFYVLTGGGLETTWVYDFSTQLWHERAYLESDGTYSQHLAVCGMFAFGKQLVGDRRNGKIYEMSLSVYSDNGDAISRERIFTHISEEGRRLRFNSLELGFETGVGLQSGQGSAPVVTLYVSQDGGRTWSSGFTGSIGAVGQYLTKVAFRRLGVSEQITFRIVITDPVKVAITGAYLK